MSEETKDESESVSSFFELEKKGTRKRASKSDSDKGDIPAVELEFLVCPLCCMNRPLKRTGSYGRRKAKQRADKQKLQPVSEFIIEDKMSARRRHYNPEQAVRLDLFDIENSPIIAIREVLGGAGGFKEVRGIPLSDLGSIGGDRYLGIVSQIRAKCIELVEEIDRYYSTNEE